jgi:hypothetical protein
MSSRQYKMQMEQHALGNCAICFKPATSKWYCDKHTILARTSARNRYRKKHGIPEDAPLLKPGRPKIGTKKK